MTMKAMAWTIGISVLILLVASIFTDNVERPIGYMMVVLCLFKAFELILLAFSARSRQVWARRGLGILGLIVTASAAVLLAAINLGGGHLVQGARLFLIIVGCFILLIGMGIEDEARRGAQPAARADG
jgi:peptidoglycan/LPS O-acetylase OafA/YrhL